MSKNLKNRIWVCELKVTDEGWVAMADLAFDTREEAREAARGMQNVKTRKKLFPTRVAPYLKGDAK